MWTIGKKELRSRLILGTAGYPSPETLRQAIAAAEVGTVTVSLRREQVGGTNPRFWDFIRDLNVDVLPNTAGCCSLQEVVTTAEMSREIFDTDWIKLEVVGDEWTLQPDPWATVAAAEKLIGMGFEVFPYMTDDLVFAERLMDAGCKTLMPWASPIGSGMGIANPSALVRMRQRFPDAQIVVDAGIGKPSDALQAMELGVDGIILNTAVSKAGDPVAMAKAFALAVRAGRLAYKAEPIAPVPFARESTPTLGRPFVNPGEPQIRAD